MKTERLVLPRAGRRVAYSQALALAAVVIGVAALLSWFTGLGEPLASLTASAPARPNSALSVLLLGLALMALPSRWPWVATLPALAVAALTTATLAEWLTGADLGFDGILALVPAAGTPPGYLIRIPPATAFALSCVAVAILVRGHPRTRPAAQALYAAAVVAAFVTLLGYLYGVSLFTDSTSPFGVSLASAVALVLLGVAGLTTDVTEGLAKLVRDPSPAGRVLRRILPAAFLIIPVAGWFRVAGARAGVFDQEVGIVLMVAFQVVVLAIVAAWTIDGLDRAERARRAAERERNRLFETAADVTAILDADGRILQAGPGWRRIYGVNPAELDGMAFAEAARVGPLPALGALARTSSLAAAEQATGGRRWIEWTVQHDRELGRSFAVGRDVTEREDALAAVRRLAAIVASSADAILALGVDGKLEEWNDAGARMFGLGPQAVGSDAGCLAVPQDREGLAAAMRGALETGQRHEAFSALRADGTTFPAELTAFPVRSPGGKVIGLSAIVRDDTAAREARASLEQYAEDLQRSNAELEQFAYMASHDLQEPLRMVTGFVGLLHKRYGEKLGPEADEYIGFAVDGARRMQALINDLLTYSRVGSRSLALAEVDLRDAAEEALANLRAAIADAGATVRVGDLPTVHGDRRQLAQLLQNLVANGIKFHGDVPPVVEIGGEHNRREWRIFVRDNGIGIDPAHHEQIFVVFRRLHAREEYEGNGIGLSIAKRIVERHRGRIWLESEIGKGTTFWVALPRGKGTSA